MNFKFIYAFGLIFILSIALLACRKKNIDLPSIKETYLYTDTNPFGASVAHNMLQVSNPSTKLIISKKEFADNYDWLYETKAIYYSISKNYYPSERDITALMEFVSKGNTAFIAANNFDDELLAKLNCNLDNYDYSADMNTYSHVSISLLPPYRLYTDSAAYYYLPFTNRFVDVKSKHTKPLGINKDNTPNFLVFFKGKGRLYIHCQPRAFSNYFLLTNTNYTYFKQIMQMLSYSNNYPEVIYWDNYYVKRNYPKNGDDNGSSLSEIFKHPSLKAAFWIGLVLLLLYILFNGKRRQRIVPVINPTENSSIAFAEAIAGLYLSHKDNKVIADKMITYYHEHVRTKYAITTNINDPTYQDIVSRKAAIPLALVKDLTQMIKAIQKSPTISDTQLLLFNELIERFNKNKIPKQV